MRWLSLRLWVLHAFPSGGLHVASELEARATKLIAKGKLPKVIIAACLRKLLKTMNTIVKTGQPWHPSAAPGTP